MALEYEPHAAVQALLMLALRSFGITGSASDMALYSAGGAELAPHVAADQAGVQPGAELVLRQRIVRGGA